MCCRITMEVINRSLLLAHLEDLCVIITGLYRRGVAAGERVFVWLHRVHQTFLQGTDKKKKLEKINDLQLRRRCEKSPASNAPRITRLARSVCISLSHSHTHPLSDTHPLPPTHTQTHALSHFLHTLCTFSLSHTLKRTHNQTLSLSHTLINIFTVFDSVSHTK